MDLPTISSLEYPYILSAAGFQLVMMPSSVLPMIASSELSTIAFMRWASSNARLCSVTSRWTADAPTIAPSSSWIGATVSETGTTDPSFRTRMVSKRLTTLPSLTMATVAEKLVGSIFGSQEAAGLADDLFASSSRTSSRRPGSSW